MAIADEIRAHKADIAARYERIVLQEVPILQTLNRATLIDHLPEFLNGLADWMEGNNARAREGFTMLAEGHALERLNVGIALDMLTTEYAVLRRVIIEELVTHLPVAEVVAAVVSLNDGIDRAIFEAVQRYAVSRDEIRERFIGILAHDLRDPLAAVRISAEMLLESHLQHPQRELVAKIDRGAARIGRMIDDVLDFARTRLGEGIPVNLVLTDLGDIAAAAVAESNTAAPRRQTRFERSGDLRGRWDADRVRQALANLLANARHYGTGEIVLRCWESSDHQRVFTSVTNEGKPIPERMLQRIFDPFERGTTAQRRGLGLGLFIVQQIALAHGADCHVTSNEREGTTFMIAWPRVPLDEMPGV